MPRARPLVRAQSQILSIPIKPPWTVPDAISTPFSSKLFMGLDISP